jgi:adenylate cyclase
VKRRLLAGAIIGAVAAGLVLGVDRLFSGLSERTGVQPFETLELKTYDWRLSMTARPETARQDIALIEIDEYSLRNLEPNAGRWPWPRVVHSSLVDYLARAPAKLVVYDVNFAEPDSRSGFAFGDTTMSGAESDAALVESVQKAGNVILLAEASYGFSGDTTKLPAAPEQGFAVDDPAILQRQAVFLPFPDLARAAAGFGHSLLMFDRDGPVRHTVPFVRSGHTGVPSLGLIAGLRGAGIPPGRLAIQGETLAIADRRMPLDTMRMSTADAPVSYLWGLIDFRGPALLADLKSRPYPSYSFFDLLYSDAQIQEHETPKVDPAVFRDKIVFVGVTAAGLADVFETPFARGKMPGIQIHAAVADDVLSGRFLGRASTLARITTVVSMALVVGLVAAWLPVWWATALSAGLLSLLAWAAFRAFASGYWLNLSQPVMASAGALFGGVAYQYFVEGREKRKMSRLFGRYVSKDVFDQLVADPSLARLGGQRREMTVLFSDIRGFTTVTERGEPEAIVETLNDYFTRMVELVFLYKGTLDKFVGDMVMALFGAPLDDRDHADHAVQTAVAMVAALGVLNKQWTAEGRPTLDLGIGINTGLMIAGNIGSEAIMSYTVIGDAVNLGARLESLNKDYGTRIIISDATRQQLKGRYDLRPLGEVIVKGKSQAVAIFEVVGAAAESSAVAPLARTSTGAAL